MPAEPAEPQPPPLGWAFSVAAAGRRVPVG